MDWHHLQVYAMSNWRRGYHFSGAADVSAWSADGSRLLNLRTSQLPHTVLPEDSVDIGFIPFSAGVPYARDHTSQGWISGPIDTFLSSWYWHMPTSCAAARFRSS